MAVTRAEVAAFIIGLIIAYDGLLLYFVPVFAVYAWRRGRLLHCLLLLTTGFALGMLPYFPESLSGWGYRFRE